MNLLLGSQHLWGSQHPPGPCCLSRFLVEHPGAGTTFACPPRCLSCSFKENCAFANRATNKHLNYCCSIFFHTSKAIKRATSCTQTEKPSYGCFGPSSFLFVGSSHEKPLACVMDLSGVVNHCQQLVSCKNTVLVDAPCNSGLHVLPPCCSCLYL